MKLAFSTLACPDWTWREVQATAADLGYDGVELRGLNGEYFLPSVTPFLFENLKETRNHLKKIKLEISCLTSGSVLSSDDSRQGTQDKAVSDLLDYIQLASVLGTKYIRVLGDLRPEPGPQVRDELVKDKLNFLGDYAKKTGVMILIETNGVYSDTKRLLNILRVLSHPNIGVLWDIHHPYRFAGEKFNETWDNLSNYIKYIHLKDSVIEGKQVKYKLFGEGNLPLTELFYLLKEVGYDGWVSLEWVKAWEPGLEEPTIAIPHFLYAYRRLLRKVEG